MTRARARSSTAQVIRFGHSMQLGWGVALGIGLVLALDVFVTPGWLIRLTGRELALGSGMALLLFLPMVLCYMERIGLHRHGDGFLGLGGPHMGGTHRFLLGWLLLLGYASLASALAWGMGLYLSILSQALFRVAIATRWLAGLAVFLVALHHILQPEGHWSLRTRLVYASLGLVLLIALWGLGRPTNSTFKMVAPEQPIDLAQTMAFLAADLWFVGLIAGYRENVQRPRRVLLPALLVPLVVGRLLGVLVGLNPGFPRAWASSPSAPAQLVPPLPSTALELGFAVAGLFICFVTMDRALANLLHLGGALGLESGLPARLRQTLPGPGSSPYGLPLAVLAVGLMTMGLSVSTVVGLASLALLWATVLLFGPRVFRVSRGERRTWDRVDPPVEGGLRLPFEPVFPGLAAVTGLFLPLALPTQVLLGGLAWMSLGALHRGTRTQPTRAQERFVSRDAPLASLRARYSVLVAIMNPETAVSLIRAGALLAEARGGHLIVLHVLDRQEEFTRNLSYLRPEQQLRMVEHFVAQADLPPGLPVTSFVRVARSTVQGIVETVKDEQVDLVLMGWEESHQPGRRGPSVWEQSLLRLRALQDPAGVPHEMGETFWRRLEVLEQASEVVDLNPILDPIVQAVTCDVAVLRGRLPQTIRQVLIPISGRSRVSTVVELGRALVQRHRGRVVTLHVVPDPHPESGTQAPPGPDAEESLLEGPSVGSPPPAQPMVASRSHPGGPSTGQGSLGAGTAVSGPATEGRRPCPINGRGVGPGPRSPSPAIPRPDILARASGCRPGQAPGAGPTVPFPDLLEGTDLGGRVERRVVRASSVVTGILEMASRFDVVLMNASRLTFLDTHFFNGIPAEVALSRQQPTILVRPYEPRHHRWLRHRWQALAAVFPKLSVAERAEIAIAMRQGAQPSIDFFVLIFLAATIATFGLLQNSGAVIIGAMLVAPLMSPIASMAMGLVEGNGQLVRVAAEATVKGIILAVSVGVAVTLLSPATQVTDQILARTQPTLLDLAVALASGAAAGYALSRKQVAAALPGVSIAVALVPPLCVVGYGIATSRYTIAGGGLLLFATNLVAIVLAAAIFFLLMGFRPLTTQQTEHLQQGLRLSLISLLLIAIPLAVLLHISLHQLRQREQLAEMEAHIRRVLAEHIPSKAAYLRNIEVVQEGEEYVVHAIFYDYTTLERALLTRIQGQLNQDLGAPVRLEATLLPAQRVGPEGEDTVPVPPSEAALAPPEEAPTTASQVTPEGRPTATPTPKAPSEATRGRR